MHIGFILLNCDLGAEEYVIDELKQMSNVTNAKKSQSFISF